MPSRSRARGDRVSTWAVTPGTGLAQLGEPQRTLLEGEDDERRPLVGEAFQAQAGGDPTPWSAAVSCDTARQAKM
jgi:hypothetical protein